MLLLLLLLMLLLLLLMLLFLPMLIYRPIIDSHGQGSRCTSSGQA
jgi:hypothetical protein